MAAKRVYRVVAHYPDRVVTRTFLTKRARDGHAEGFRDGREGEWLPDGREGSVQVGYIEKADRVEVLDSEPLIFHPA